MKVLHAILNNIYVAIFLAIFLSPYLLLSQEANTLLFSSFQSENKVLELNIKPSFSGNYFALGAIVNNQVHAIDFVARQGKHCYDLRTLPSWKGKIDYLVTTLPKEAILSSNLIQSNFLQELDMFLDAEAFTPKLINFTRPKTLFGTNFNFIILLVIVFSFFILLLIAKKGITQVAIIAILLGIVITDVRSIVDHLRIANQIEDNHLAITPIDFPQKFLEQAKPLMVGGNWALPHKLKDEYYYLYTKYQLADILYVPKYVKTIPKGTFIISNEPQPNQEAVLEQNGFYLLKQQ